jgi:hypothetical protein
VPAGGDSPGGTQFDEKNIRRRVYDALNVLMAMDIISKDKKEISWQGLPLPAGSEVAALSQQKQDLLEKINKQHTHIQVTSLFGVVRGFCQVQFPSRTKRFLPLDFGAGGGGEGGKGGRGRSPCLRAARLPR